MDWKEYLKNEEEVMAGLRGLAKSTPALPDAAQRAIGEAPGGRKLIVELRDDAARVLVAGRAGAMMSLFLGQSYAEKEVVKILGEHGSGLVNLTVALSEAGIGLMHHYPSNTLKAVRHGGKYERTYEAGSTSRLQVDVDGAYLRVGVPGAAKYILSFTAGNDYLAESMPMTLSRLGGGATMADLERAMSDKGYGTVLDPVLDRVKFIKLDEGERL